MKTSQLAYSRRNNQDIESPSIAAGKQTLTQGFPAPMPEGEPEPRPTELVFRFDAAALWRYAQGDEVAMQIVHALDDFTNMSTKDGVQLTDEQKLCVAVQTMTKNGVSKRQQAILISKVFFGHAKPEMGKDFISMVLTTATGVEVRFAHDGAPGVEILPLKCEAPAVYTGKDTNYREARVQAAKDDFIASNGRPMAYGRDSFLFIEHDAIRARFLETIGSEWATRPAAELDASTAFRDALEDYKRDVLMTKYVERVGGALLDASGLRAWAATTPTPTVDQLVAAAIPLVLGFTDPDLCARPHGALRVEDEAVLQWMLEQLGYTINLDADTLGAFTSTPNP